MQLLTVSDVADKLRFSTSQVYKLAEKGKLKAYKLESSLRFKEAEIDDYIQSRAMTYMPAKST